MSSIALKDALAQTAEVNELFKKFAEIDQRFDGNRVAYQLRANFEFRAGANDPGTLTFNVPEDSDFYGLRLSLFLQFRRVNLESDVQSDRVWRPAFWVFDSVSGGSSDRLLSADAAFRISTDSRELQSAPESVLAAFSGTMVNSGVNAFPGALEFHEPVFLRRGGTCTVTITPTFSRAVVTSNVMREFRIAAVFDGFKPLAR